MRTLRRLLACSSSLPGGSCPFYVFVWFRDRYSGRGPMPYTMRWILHAPLRRLLHPVQPMLDKFGLQAGHHSPGVGPRQRLLQHRGRSPAGRGGRLVCLDIQPPMLHDLRGRLAAAGVTNAHPVLGHAHHLPGGCSSRTAPGVLGDRAGYIPDRPQGLAELRRRPEPGGALSITESLTDSDYQFEGTVRDVCRASGFTPRDHHRGLLASP